MSDAGSITPETSPTRVRCSPLGVALFLLSIAWEWNASSAEMLDLVTFRRLTVTLVHASVNSRPDCCCCCLMAGLSLVHWPGWSSSALGCPSCIHLYLCDLYYPVSDLAARRRDVARGGQGVQAAPGAVMEGAPKEDSVYSCLTNILQSLPHQQLYFPSSVNCLQQILIATKWRKDAKIVINLIKIQSFSLKISVGWSNIRLKKYNH